MTFLGKLKNHPWAITGIIFVLVLAWMLTGVGAENGPEDGAATDRQQERETDVRVRRQQAEPVQRFVEVYGRTAPARSVVLKAETGGRVADVSTERGAYVNKGDELLVLDMRDRREQRERARAEVRAAQMRFEAEQRLQEEQFASQTRLAEAQAQLDAARAELRRIEVDLENTRIRAPFNGALQDRVVETGDYVAIGDPVATFVEVDRLIVTGSVSETERANLEIGDTATARLVTGQTAEGRVRFIEPVADKATRTFRIELEVANPERTLPAGVTAQIRMPAGERLAHRVSPAILTLDDDGEIGIKTVAEDNTVRFNKIEIVRSTGTGMWIAGLPEQANIITVGQGFVRPGEKVKPVFESSGETAALATEHDSQ